MFDPTGQARVFLFAAGAGFASGALYEVLRLLRRLLRAGPLLTGAQDLLFWAASAALLAVAAARADAEGLRLYMLLGAACGALLFMAGFRGLCALAAGKRAPREE